MEKQITGEVTNLRWREKEQRKNTKRQSLPSEFRQDVKKENI